MNRYEALKHAVKAHAGQFDKCGQPYILHPIAVAEAVQQTNPPDAEVRTDEIVALLHDVWEDTDYAAHNDSLSRLELEALKPLTRREGETYADYIERVIAAGEIAVTVKLADIWHNLQPERQACLPEKERKSLEARYLKARDQIWEALGYEWWPKEGWPT